MEVLYSLNVFDIILIVVCIFFVIKGFMKGFLYEITAVIGFLLSLWIAYIGYAFLGGILRRYIPSQQWSDILAYIGLFCMVMIVFTLITSMLSRHINFKGGGFIDFLGGGILGGVKGVIVCVFIVVILDHVLPSKTFIGKSQLSAFIYKEIQVFQQKYAYY